MDITSKISKDIATIRDSIHAMTNDEMIEASRSLRRLESLLADFRAARQTAEKWRVGRYFAPPER